MSDVCTPAVWHFPEAPNSASSDRLPPYLGYSSRQPLCLEDDGDRSQTLAAEVLVPRAEVDSVEVGMAEVSLVAVETPVVVEKVEVVVVARA